MADTDPNTYSALADVLGGAAKSGAGANQFRDALKIALENAKLNRDKYAATVPGTRLSTGMRASLASHAQPAHMQWGGPGSGLRGEIPHLTGGRNSIFDAVKDPTTKALIDRVMGDTTAAQVRGGTTGGGQDTAMPTGIGQTSLMDKILGGGALGSGILGALQKGSGSGGSIDLGKLLGNVFHRGGSGGSFTEDPNNFFEGPQNPNEFQGPMDYTPPSAGNANGGLNDFYDWLDKQNAGGGDRGSAIGEPDAWGF